jgi:RHS repeat-associated protein
MRRDGVLQYIAADHLGTTSLVLDDQGNRIAESRHLPYGEERWSWVDGGGDFPTEYRFTGQREQAGVGLYHMGARFYDAYINRFVSPDSIVPQPANPQSLNRFSYALGNPLRYRDPTGHWEEEWEEQFEQEHGRTPTEQDWWDYQFSLQIENWKAALWEQTFGLRSVLWNAEVTVRAGDLKWTLQQVGVVRDAVQSIADRFGGSVSRFTGGVTIILDTECEPWWGWAWRILFNKPGIDFGGYQEGKKIHFEADNINVVGIIHELGHYFDKRNHNRISRDYQEELSRVGLAVDTNRYEDFANAFMEFVLGRDLDLVKEEYLREFLEE